MKKTVQIYLDMDGVLANFDKGIIEIYPEFNELNRLYHDALNTEDDKIKRAAMADAIKNTPDFWKNLEWEPGGQEVWEFVKQYFYKPAIITSPMIEDLDRCINQKLHWVESTMKYNIDFERFIPESEKHLYVNCFRGDLQILIDDRWQNIQNWKNHGGIGIFHNSKDYSKTLDFLSHLV